MKQKSFALPIYNLTIINRVTVLADKWCLLNKVIAQFHMFLQNNNRYIEFNK